MGAVSWSLAPRSAEVRPLSVGIQPQTARAALTWGFECLMNGARKPASWPARGALQSNCNWVMRFPSRGGPGVPGQQEPAPRGESQWHCPLRSKSGEQSCSVGHWLGPLRGHSAVV